MKNGESIFERLSFAFTIGIKMLIPPLLSLERLERYCKQRIEQNPSVYSPRWFLADLYKFYEKDREALTEYAELDKLGYLDQGQQFSYAEVLYRSNSFDDAIARFLNVEDSYKDDKAYNFYIGMSFMRKALYEEAMPYLTRATTGATKRGGKQFRRVINDAALYEAIGFCYFNLGKLALSADAYRKALTIDQTSARVPEIRNNAAKAHIHLANQFLLEQQNAEAIRQLHLALEIQPDQSISQEIQRTLYELGNMTN